MARRLLFFALLAVCLVLVARVSERHGWRADLSAQRIHSLSDGAARALDALPERLSITVFIPDYPVQRAQLKQLLAPYLAHSTNIQLDFVDPVEQPEVARERGVSRHGEIHLASGPRREVLTEANRQALDLALNRLALRGERWIVGFKGHGESTAGDGPDGLGRFVAHVEQLGYRFVALDPRQLDALPENTALLLVAGPREPYDEHAVGLVERHLAGGGALLWLTDAPLPGFFARDLGISLLPGIVVDAAAARYRLDSPDNAIVAELPEALQQNRGAGGHGVLKRAHALEVADREGWRTLARLQTGPNSWNETDGLTGEISRDPTRGEQAGPLTVGLLMTPNVAGNDGGVAVIGSPHLISNDQIGQGANLEIAVGLVRWLTANRQLADAPPAADFEIRWSPEVAAWLAFGLMAGLPLLYLVAGLWLRARRRRA